MKKVLLMSLVLLALGAVSCQSSSLPVADLDDLVDRLQQAGATIEITDRPIKSRHLSGKGLTLVINRDRLQVFEYDDTVKASREFKSLTDPSVPGIVIFGDGEPPLGETISSEDQAYRSGRFIVLYGGEDEGALSALKETLGRASQRK